MRIAALKNTDAWYSRLMNELGKDRGRIDSQVLAAVPVEDVVVVDSVELEHDGPENHYRPFLRIGGTLRAQRPSVELPYGVDGVDYPSAPATYMSYRYDFDDDQLARLVGQKGLFTEGFKVPKEMLGLEWELPGSCDYFVVSPASYEDAPIVFVTIHEQNEHVIDLSTSGYELVEYFPDAAPQAQAEAEAGLEDGALVRDDLDEDLFAGVEPQAPRFAETGRKRLSEGLAAPEDEARQEGASIFERMVAAAGDRLRRRAEDAAPAADEPEVDPASPEGVYAERISREVADARATAPEPLSLPDQDRDEAPEAGADEDDSFDADDLFADEPAPHSRVAARAARAQQADREAPEGAEGPGLE